jgi:3-hydroxyacyl-[acyl-carrier-protein] dehydratase
VALQKPGDLGKWTAGRVVVGPPRESYHSELAVYPVYAIVTPCRFPLVFAMRFFLIDRVEGFVPGERLSAIKGVSYSESYIHDHFPEFAVLPGVFMLEAATQASAWLLRLSENFAHSMILLREAKNIKYANFVQPGRQLRVEVEKIGGDDRFATFKVAGAVDDQPTLSGRIVVERFNLADRDANLAESDARVLKFLHKASKAIVPATLLDTLPAVEK